MEATTSRLALVVALLGLTLMGRTLAELRKARELTQKEVADRLRIAQPQVAKLEKRTDVYLSTLARYLEATGCWLPDGGRAEIRLAVQPWLAAL